MLIIYGIIFSIAGVFIFFFKRLPLSEVSTTDIYAILSIAFGITSILLAVFGFRRLLVGPKWPSDRRGESDKS